MKLFHEAGSIYREFLTISMMFVKNPDLCNTPHSNSSLWGKFGVNFTANILSALKGAKSFMYLQVSQIECGN